MAPSSLLLNTSVPSIDGTCLACSHLAAAADWGASAIAFPVKQRLEGPVESHVVMVATGAEIIAQSGAAAILLRHVLQPTAVQSVVHTPEAGEPDFSF